MQGRLSPLVNGRIQAFPWDNWEKEFGLSQTVPIHLMEWTLDHEDLYLNPLMSDEGRQQIAILQKQFNLRIPSVTVDAFMQAPFWKVDGDEQRVLLSDFWNICESSSAAQISQVVIPLVDNGRLENSFQEETLLEFLDSAKTRFANLNLRVCFEIDYAPQDVEIFIGKLDSKIFGINYDIGNSASLGFSPEEEFGLYGNRIMNVHVKDRLLHGSTVPLGEGNADFEKVFALISKNKYEGNFILQTARDRTNEHVGAIKRYLEITQGWLQRSYES